MQKYGWKQFRRSLILFRNRLRVAIHIERAKGLPRLVFSETWKKPTRYALWLINACGWATALITIQPWSVAVLVAIGFSTISFLVGRNLFYYKSFVTRPIPPSEWNQAKWLGVSLGRTYTDDGYAIPSVALVFGDESSARLAYDIIMNWTNGRTRRVSEYITLSIILLNDSHYILYLYPNLSNSEDERFYSQLEDKKRREAEANHTVPELHSKRFITSYIANTCTISEGSETQAFLEHYREGMPVIIEILVRTSNGDVMLHDYDWITLQSVKVRQRTALTEGDFEFAIIDVLGTFEN